MAYVPNPTDVTQPVESVLAQTAAAEFRALKAYIQTIVSGGGPGATPPGAFQFFQLLTPPPGWIAGDGTTMGDLGSGAGQTGPQFQALFLAWWDYSDAILPIYTSTGVLSARGASALADWSALKRLSIFDVRNRYPRGAGVRAPNGVVQPATRWYYDNINDATLRVAHAGTQPIFPDEIFSDNINQIFTGSAGSGVSLTTTASSKPDSLVMLGCYKL